MHHADGRSAASTQTGSDGFFVFDEVLPDEYYLKIDLPDGYLFTQPDAALSNDQEWQDSDVDPATGRTPNFTMASGDGNLNLDAGLVEPASIGNRVWLDENGDGIQDSGEAGVPNIAVELLQKNSSNQEYALVSTTFTDQNGEFIFANLQPALYAIQISQGPTFGYGFSPQDAGDSDELDSDINPQTGQTSDTLLEPGEDDSSWDVGLFSVPKVAITIDNNDLEASPNQSIIYTINYKNEGDIAADSVLITKEIPAHTEFDAASSTDGWNCIDDTECTYSLATVPSQEAKQLRFAVKVDAALPNSPRFFDHELSISYRSQSMSTSIPDVTQSTIEQIRFNPPQIIDLQDFDANLTGNNEILFSWELASENDVDRFQIDIMNGAGKSQTVSSVPAIQSESQYESLLRNDEIHSVGLDETFWLTAFDDQGNGIRYGPFHLQADRNSGLRDNSLYLPLILQP